MATMWFIVLRPLLQADFGYVKRIPKTKDGLCMKEGLRETQRGCGPCWYRRFADDPSGK